MVQKCKFPGKSATIRNVLGLNSQIVTILGILSAKIYEWLIRYWFKHLHPVFSARGSICTLATEESQNQVYPCSYLSKTISAQSVQNDAPPPPKKKMGAVSSSTAFFWPPQKNLQTQKPDLESFLFNECFCCEESSIRKATLTSCSQWQVSSGCIFHEFLGYQISQVKVGWWKHRGWTLGSNLHGLFVGRVRLFVSQTHDFQRETSQNKNAKCLVQLKKRWMSHLKLQKGPPRFKG